ncbi:putative dynein heavy chain [Schistosoma mansoni]|nr:putative dynein heavy chain [Schistosoma mansoni]|eukprot:XP_018654465.1 putative dynein heavy chain [Schistosoma mansoni]
MHENANLVYQVISVLI